MLCTLSRGHSLRIDGVTVSKDQHALFFSYHVCFLYKKPTSCLETASFNGNFGVCVRNPPPPPPGAACENNAVCRFQEYLPPLGGGGVLQGVSQWVSGNLLGAGVGGHHGGLVLAVMVVRAGPPVIVWHESPVSGAVAGSCLTTQMLGCSPWLLHFVTLALHFVVRRLLCCHVVML